MKFSGLTMVARDVGASGAAALDEDAASDCTRTSHLKKSELI
jgi:hypothetical protein